MMSDTTILRKRKIHSIRQIPPTMLPTKGRLIRLMSLIESKKGLEVLDSYGALVKELRELLHRRIGTEDHDTVVGLYLHITVDQHRHAVAHQTSEGDTLR